jgi:hypothetical protein
MTAPRPRSGRRISHELRPYVDSADAERVDEIADRLIERRPRPRPAFRSELRAQLTQAEARGYGGWRPKNLRAAILAFSASGVALLTIAAVGVAGAGPLGF